MACCFAGRCHVHMELGAEVSMNVWVWAQTDGWPADSPIERKREREKQSERESLAKAKFSILNTFHICAAPPIVVAECRCRSAI